MIELIYPNDMHRNILFILVLIFFTLSLRNIAFSATFDPRIKTVGKTAIYGTVGGALLGTASLAFGADGKWIARGASVGLYSGLLFGGYLLISHQMRKGQPQGPRGPYQNRPRYKKEDGDEYDEYYDDGYTQNRNNLEYDFHTQGRELHVAQLQRQVVPEFQMPIVYLEF